MNQKKKKAIGLAASLCLIAVIGAGLYVKNSFFTTLSPEDTLIRINKEKISKEEFQTLLPKYRAEIMGEYTTDEANQEDFWETSKNGQKPVELITQKVLDELTEKKVTKQMAVNEGLIKDFSFETLKKGLTQENEKRHSKVEQDQVIYGKTQYDLETYYQYIYSNIEAVLSRQLRSQAPVTQKQMEKYYQDHKEDYYCEQIVTVLDAQSSDPDLLEQAAFKMKEETDLSVLEKEFPDISFSMLTLSSADTQAGKTGIYQERWEKAKELQPRELSEIYTAGSGYGIMVCKDRQEDAYLSFSQEAETIQAILQEQYAKQEIQKETEAAQIQYKEKNLEQAALEVLKE